MAATTFPPVPEPVDPDLLKRIRHAARTAQKATEERDRLMTEAVMAGGSLRDIGAAAMLSHTAVGFVVHGRNKNLLSRDQAGVVLTRAETAGPTEAALACLLILNRLKLSQALALTVEDARAIERPHRTVYNVHQLAGDRTTGPLFGDLTTAEAKAIIEGLNP